MKTSSLGHLPKVVAILAASLIATVASTATAQTLDDVIAKCVQAQGGRDALMTLKALQRKGTVKLDGAVGQLEGTIEEIVIPWKKAARSIDLNVFAQKIGYNGKVAWVNGPMGVQDLEGEEARQIKQLTDLNPLLLIGPLGIKAEKLDDETIDGVAYYVIRLSPKDQPSVKLFIDKQSDLLCRTTLTQNNPQFGKVDVVVRLSDYQQFGPVKLATKSKASMGDVMVIDTAYTETKVNGEVDDAIFEKPKD